MQNRVPAVPGGGTVSYVSPAGHRFLSDPSGGRGRHAGHRGCSQGGACFQTSAGGRAERIERIEQQHIRYALDAETHSDIDVLGNRKLIVWQLPRFALSTGIRICTTVSLLPC